MRRRHQKGNLKKFRGNWVAQWWENGHRRNKTLGFVSEMTKSEAQTELDSLLTPLNLSTRSTVSFGDFIEKAYFPFFKRKWKHSTASTTESRIRYHILNEFSDRLPESIMREELQDFLDKKTRSGLSYGTIDHLKWDLKQILDFAMVEDVVKKNVAKFLFTLREAVRSPKRRLKWKEVNKILDVLETRDRLIVMLAIVGGMRPGEIFGLQWRHVNENHLDIRQRVYRGIIDSPKSRHSVRSVALSDGIKSLFETWKSECTRMKPTSWVFPSENPKTPLWRDNCWRRSIKPKLERVGMSWANFRVMRRTHSSLMRELDIDPKMVADQLGHTLDVNLNVYTASSLGNRKRAVDTLEESLLKLNGVQTE